MTAIRTNITFWFDEAAVSEAAIKDRLDELLVEHFGDCQDWHTRWYTDLADSPLFGAGKRRSQPGDKVFLISVKAQSAEAILIAGGTIIAGPTLFPDDPKPAELPR